MKAKVIAAAAAARAKLGAGGDAVVTGGPLQVLGASSQRAVANSLPERALVTAACAGCKASNEVAVPVGGEERSFQLRCYACAKLNQLTIDTGGGGPIVVARIPPEWASAPTAGSTPVVATTEGSGGALSGVPLKKRAKSLALAVSGGGARAAAAVVSAPAPPPPPPALVRGSASASASATKKVVVRTGHDVVALFHDGYYYHGTVDDARHGEGQTTTTGPSISLISARESPLSNAKLFQCLPPSMTPKIARASTKRWVR